MPTLPALFLDFPKEDGSAGSGEPWPDDVCEEEPGVADAPEADGFHLRHRRWRRRACADAADARHNPGGAQQHDAAASTHDPSRQHAAGGAGR